MMRLVFSVLLLGCLGWGQTKKPVVTLPTSPNDWDAVLVDHEWHIFHDGKWTVSQCRTIPGGQTDCVNDAPKAVPDAIRVVEAITAEQKKALDAARANLKKAQEDLDAVEMDVRYRHGQTNGRWNPCSTSETTVTIWFDYALVDTHPSGGCVSW